MEDTLCFLPGIEENFCINTEFTMILPGVLDASFNTLFDTEITEAQVDDTPNCLALTVVPDYKYLSVKNLLTRSAHITYKIIFSTIILNVIKLFI